MIAATNRELLQDVKENKFREDLYYRLNVMPMYSIPLRERRDDICLLLKYYLFKVTGSDNLQEFFTEDAIKLLENYYWPGNIRELVNIVEYSSTIKEKNEKISVYDLPTYMLGAQIDKVNSEDKVQRDDELDKWDIWVLNKIYKHGGIGRRTLSMMSQDENSGIGESKIRNIMSKLRSEGYIEINKGLKGTKILDKGIEKLKKG